MKYLCIDPSGSGITGLAYYEESKNKWEFTQIQSANWEEHFVFILNYCRQKEVEIIIYESTNYISLTNRSKHMTSLFKLFGAIESLKYMMPQIKECQTVLVGLVKALYKKIYHKKVEIKNLNYKAGRGGGWLYDNQRLSLHQLDAFLLYQLAKNTPLKPK
ncbi:MAG: hypothetical protein I3273_06580 [Candidatus Moeniiplasma glomeromycotorum]|nr:hypothetical protein [Candidatus Moeniiplasma glomeromycotorum]MCE8162588.1 hypothetical protein [Candidatus Moeniiplasma glomeromycotorum]MCE8163479.1 hypothetical protein [Candidatus Moeniiplasma glomeromycotorum]MCE8166488.1 hypothetical protein [Candidatus Moeniiplasma glomeromycotorum]MCE8166971.1 hypothetical protein [Candidatus Moeniiplasma glomeromycotorum]